MSDAHPKSGDIPALVKCLENLEICLAEHDDGFTIYTTSEPLFCFTRSTEKECDKVVVDTLRSYLDTFYQVENVQIRAFEVDVEQSIIPQLKLKPVSRRRPVFENAGGRREIAQRRLKSHPI